MGANGRSRRGCLYAAKHTLNGFIKIGFSCDPIRRIRSLVSKSSETWPQDQRAPLQLLGWVPNKTQAYEKLLHHRCWATVVNGEWHHPDSPGVSEILSDPAFLPCSHPLFVPTGIWHVPIRPSLPPVKVESAELPTVTNTWGGRREKSGRVPVITGGLPARLATYRSKIRSYVDNRPVGSIVIDLKPGWCLAADLVTHQVVGDGIAQCSRELRVVVPCRCLSCKTWAERHA